MSSQRNPDPQEPSSPTNTTASGDSFDRALAKVDSQKVVSPPNPHVINLQNFDFRFSTRSQAIRPRSVINSKTAHGVMDNEPRGTHNSSTNQANTLSWHGIISDRPTGKPRVGIFFWLLLGTVLSCTIDLVAAVVMNAMHAHKRHDTIGSGTSGTSSKHLKAWLGISIPLFIVSCGFFGYAFTRVQKNRRNANAVGGTIGRIGRFEASSNTHTVSESGQFPQSTSNILNRGSSANNSIEVASNSGLQILSRVSSRPRTSQPSPASLLHPRDKQQAVPGPSQTSLSVYSQSNSSDDASLVTASEGDREPDQPLFSPRISSLNAPRIIAGNPGSMPLVHTACTDTNNMTTADQPLSLPSDLSAFHQRPIYGITSGRCASFNLRTTDTYARHQVRPSTVTYSSIGSVRPESSGCLSGFENLARGHQISHPTPDLVKGMQQAAAVQIRSLGRPTCLLLNKEGNVHQLSRSVGDLDDLVEESKDEKATEKAMTMKESGEKGTNGGNVHIQVIPATPENPVLPTTPRRPDSCPPMAPESSPHSSTGAVWGTPLPPGETQWGSPSLKSTVTTSALAPANSSAKMASTARPPTLQNRSYETLASLRARIPRSSFAVGGVWKPSRNANERSSLEKDLPPLPLSSHPPSPPSRPQADPDVKHASSRVPLLSIRSSPLDTSVTGSNALNIKCASETYLPAPETPIEPVTAPLIVQGSPTKRGPPFRSVSDEQVTTQAAMRRVRRSSMGGLSDSTRVDYGKWLVYAKGLGL